MSSCLYIIDSTARRYKFQTTPDTYLRDILEQVCEKLDKKDPDQYSLTELSRPTVKLDLSIPLRQVGLINGCKLQLVQISRSVGPISVALQLPEQMGNARREQVFASNTSLWQVLRQFEDGVTTESSRMNITQRSRVVDGSHESMYEQPAVHVLGRNLQTFPELQRSFMQLGVYSGSVHLRLSFVSSDKTLQQTMSEISDYFAARR